MLLCGFLREMISAILVFKQTKNVKKTNWSVWINPNPYYIPAKKRNRKRTKEYCSIFQNRQRHHWMALIPRIFSSSSNITVSSLFFSFFFLIHSPCLSYQFFILRTLHRVYAPVSTLLCAYEKSKLLFTTLLKWN